MESYGRAKTLFSWHKERDGERRFEIHRELKKQIHMEQEPLTATVTFSNFHFH